jgi:thioesterase domain-containing protein
MEHCVDEYVTEIQRFYPRGPVHLGGWCAAASLTIEIARRLMAEGRTVGMVALFDADAPGFVAQTPGGSPRLAGLRARTDFHRGRMRGMTWTGRLRYLWERLTQVPVNLVEKFYLRNHLKLLRWQKHFPWLPGALFYNRFTQVGLLQAERLEQIDARIQLFRARDVTMIPGSDEALGWGEIARQGVDVTFIPGHHESMFLEPNVEVLQDRFRASIRTIEGKLALQPPTRSTL